MISCLLVDDSRVVRKVARRIIEEIGFECVEAEDGEKAFSTCQDHMPDVILLDWNMPVMSGLECMEKIRELDGGDHPKIIFCTTENDMTLIQRALMSGANEYIMKPFDSHVLQEKFIRVGLIPAVSKTIA